MNDPAEFFLFVLLIIVVTISYKIPIYLAQAMGYSSELNHIWTIAKADGTASLVIMWTVHMTVGFMLWTMPIYFTYRRFNHLFNSSRKKAAAAHPKPQAAQASATRPGTPQSGTRGSLEEALSSRRELANLIGLDQVKREVEKLVLGAEYAKRRQKAGLPVDKPTLHLVFTGNPGTGKTTVARLVGQIYHELGLLAKGHVVEVGRHDLVGKYIGQTAPQTTEKLQEALDGVLFIDEAYTLAREAAPNDFGPEAIDSILVFMENNRDRISIIAAGYQSEMSRFINSNPGLKSRFTRYIHFEDYTVEECTQILEQMAAESQYRFSHTAKEAAKTAIRHLKESEHPHFSNGRAVRNLFERIREKQNMRVMRENATDLITIELEDIELN